MVKGSPRIIKAASLPNKNNGLWPLFSKRIQVVNKNIVSSGATGAGFGAVELEKVPEGNIFLFAAASYFVFSSVSSSITATFTGSYSLGTTATADATLSGTDANIVAAATLSAATGKVSPRTRSVSGSSILVLDNTDTTIGVNLNLVIDDGSISADNVTIVANGYVDLRFAILGDD
jgi:hypothetical protein